MIRIHLPDEEAPENLLTKSLSMIRVETLSICWVFHP